MDDLGASLAFGFGLLGDGALHLFRNVHLLDFNLADFDAPGFGILVENDLQFRIQFVALREDFIQFELPDDAAQRGLGQLRSGVLIILHLRHGQVGVDYPEIANRVDFHRNVVAGDDVLRGNVERFQPHIDAIQRLNGPENQVKASRLCLGEQASEAQHYTTLPLLNDVQRIPDPDQENEQDEQQSNATYLKHVGPPLTLTPTFT